MADLYYIQSSDYAREQVICESGRMLSLLTHCVLSCLLVSRSVICEEVSRSRSCLPGISCVAREVLSGYKMLCLSIYSICD